MLVNGQWTSDWHPSQSEDSDGRFERQPSTFRHWVTPNGDAGPDGANGFKAEAGRYHLYVALTCPWASRALMVRKLKRLDEVLSVSVVDPRLTNRGWRFGGYPGAEADPYSDSNHLHEIYTRANPNYTGRVTVPVLWDRQHKTIVNNESADIVRILNGAFDAFADTSVDLYPEALRSEIDEVDEQLYDGLNNGVYRAGFASTQEAYNEAVIGVFETLDSMETRLADDRRFLFGEHLTESDVRLFVTLVRFDAAYHGLFKCNIRQLADYKYLTAYTHRILDLPGIAETVNMDHIKAGYYSIAALNPNGIVPIGPLPGITATRH